MNLSCLISQNQSENKLIGINEHQNKPQMTLLLPPSPSNQKSFSQSFGQHSQIIQRENKNQEILDGRRNNSSALRDRQTIMKSASMQFQLYQGSTLLIPDQTIEFQQARIPQTTQLNSSTQNPANINGNCYAFRRYDPDQPLQQIPNSLASQPKSQGFFKNGGLTCKNQSSIIGNQLEKDKSPTMIRHRNLSDHQYLQNQQQQQQLIKIRSKQQKYLLELQAKQDITNKSQIFEKINPLSPDKINNLLKKKDKSLGHNQNLSEAKKNLNDFKDYIAASSQILSQNTKISLYHKHPLRSNYIIKQKNSESNTKNYAQSIQQVAATVQQNHSQRLNRGEFISLLPGRIQQNNVHQPKSIIKLSGGQFTNESNIGQLTNNFESKQIHLQTRLNPSKSRENYDRISTPNAKKEEMKFVYENIKRKRTLSNISNKNLQKLEKDVQTDLPDAQFQTSHPYSNIKYNKLQSNQGEQSPIIRLIEAQKEHISINEEKSHSQPNLAFSSKVPTVQNNFQNFNDYLKKQIEQKQLNFEDGQNQMQLKPTFLKIQTPPSKANSEAQPNTNSFSSLLNQSNILKHSTNAENTSSNNNQMKQIVNQDHPTNNEVYLISKYINSNIDSPHFYHKVSKIQYSSSKLNSSKSDSLSKSSLNFSTINLQQQQLVSAQYPHIKLSNNDDYISKFKFALQNNQPLNQDPNDPKIIPQQQQYRLQHVATKQELNDLISPKHTKTNTYGGNINHQSAQFSNLQNKQIIKNIDSKVDYSIELVQPSYLQNFETLQMSPHYHAYQTSSQNQKRANSYNTKANYDTSPTKPINYTPKRLNKKQLILQKKPQKNNLHGKSQQLEESSKANDCSDEDILNESVQPWSRKDSELDISIF